METMNARHAGRLVVWACVAATMAATAVVTVRGDNAAAYAQVVETLRKELAIPFTSPEDPGLLQRRARLRTLFASVPPSHAKTLFDRLGVKPTKDELSEGVPLQACDRHAAGAAGHSREDPAAGAAPTCPRTKARAAAGLGDDAAAAVRIRPLRHGAQAPRGLVDRAPTRTPSIGNGGTSAGSTS